MLNERILQSVEKLNDLAATTDNAAVKDAIEHLRTAISVGNISNSTGVAIGRNIRMVVNNLNLPPETVAKILEVRPAERDSEREVVV